MSHNRIDLNGVSPDSSGNVSIDADEVAEGALGGYTPYVDTRLGQTSLSALSDVSAGGTAGQVLEYGGASWSGGTVTGQLLDGCRDWRWPTSATTASGAFTRSTPGLYNLGHESLYGVVVSTTGTTPVNSKYYANAAANGFVPWPTAYKLKAGKYLFFGQTRVRFSGSNPAVLQWYNWTTSTPLGPMIRCQTGESADTDATVMFGCGTVANNDVVGIHLSSGAYILQNNQEHNGWIFLRIE